MNRFLTLLLAFGFGSAMAQVPNLDATDCQSNTQDLYTALAQNKPLLVMAHDVDCSSCQSSASGWNTFSTQNTDYVYWAAMGTKYPGATLDCSGITNWLNTYSWANMFVFNREGDDEASQWASSFTNGGTPYYTVVDPRNQTVFWAGTSSSTAQSKLNELKGQLLSSRTGNAQNLFATWPNPTTGSLVLQQTQAGPATWSLTNSLGQTLLQGQTREQTTQLNLQSLPAGTYVLVVSTSAGRQHQRVIRH